MTLARIRTHCLGKPGVEECLPFDEKTLVFKVLGKMFLIVNIDTPVDITLKCNPAKAIELREQYVEIKAGYHCNKKHWNTLSLQGSLSDNFIVSLIDHSYEVVVEKMPKQTKQKLVP